jgi:hypothetical protein
VERPFEHGKDLENCILSFLQSTSWYFSIELNCQGIATTHNAHLLRAVFEQDILRQCLTEKMKRDDE